MEKFLKEEAVLTALCDALDNGDLIYDIPGATEEEAIEAVNEEINRLSKIIEQKQS